MEYCDRDSESVAFSSGLVCACLCNLDLNFLVDMFAELPAELSSLGLLSRILMTNELGNLPSGCRVVGKTPVAGPFLLLHLGI